MSHINYSKLNKMINLDNISLRHDTQRVHSASGEMLQGTIEEKSINQYYCEINVL